ncbi:hypothetical protein WA158_004404 [Blastocystis sp. Blastoise]
MSSLLGEEENYTGTVVTRKQIKRDYPGKVEWNLPRPNELIDGEAKRIRSEQRKKIKSELKSAIDSDIKDTNADNTEPISRTSEFSLPKRRGTVSIAVPASIIDLCQILELKTIVAGQISRIASMFMVDEIVVFRDMENKKGQLVKADEFLAKVLQYQETPQYLKKAIFPFCKELQFVGLLSPLEIPSHVHKNEFLKYREGVVTETITTGNKGSFVDVGLDTRTVLIPQMIQKGVRVTIQFDNGINLKSKTLTGKAVSPLLPRGDLGLYWGYRTRAAESLQTVFDSCPYKEGYDITIGISTKSKQYTIDPEFQLPSYQHLMIVFGGAEGIEEAIEADEHIKTHDPASLFTYFLNPIYSRGCRNVRTEEMISMTLSTLQINYN